MQDRLSRLGALMKRTVLLFLGMLSVVVGVGFRGFAQSAQRTAPDFTGTWTLSTSESAFYSPVGSSFMVTQQPSAITLTPGSGQPVTYLLGDQETHWSTRTAAGDQWNRTARTRFVTNALVITTLSETPIGRWEDAMVLSLDSLDTL